MPADADDEPVTLWIEQLKAGDPAAARPLWNGYFARLVSLARRRLRGLSQAVADGEDIALSAFDSFCQGVAGGRFPDLNDRDDLWRVLFDITTKKAWGEIRYQTRQKRGGGKVVPASAVNGEDLAGPGLLATVAGREPTPAFAAEVAEECRRLLDDLRDPQLTQIAVWKMEGFTNVEIAEKIGRAVPTVERKLARIRAIWVRTP